jgi:hypothetical protein
MRLKDTSPEQLQRWFDSLEKVLAEFNIKPENIYNMVEKKQRDVLLMLIIAKSFKQSLDIKNGLQWWNVQMEVSFLLSLFSKWKSLNTMNSSKYSWELEVQL